MSIGLTPAKLLREQIFQSDSLYIPELEYQFHKPRRWRFDLAWPDMLAVEIEGGVFTNGRHTRGVGFLKDMEKYNQAAVDGWFLLRVTPSMILDGSALELIKRFWEAHT